MSQAEKVSLFILLLAVCFVAEGFAQIPEAAEAVEAVVEPHRIGNDLTNHPLPGSPLPKIETIEPPAVKENAKEDVTPQGKPNYFSEYKKGFAIRPHDFAKNPFELQINGWGQFRYHAFSRSAESWTDNAGVTREIRNRSVFDTERARLVFSGRVLDRRLSYFLNIDGDSDGAEVLDFLDYWWAWEFSKAFKLQMGKRKVPASTQWQMTARNTRLIDRPMANDFFRPDRTTGIFGVGEIVDGLNYELMVGNGYRTANVVPDDSDNHFTYAAMSTWDPLGSYGTQIVDFDGTSDLLMRLGHSFIYSPQSKGRNGSPFGETNFIRLTDGTQLIQEGALTPGVIVSSLDIYFYGVDMAAKWQGWSVNAEVYMRWLEQLRGDGPLPHDRLFQRGFYIEGGRFLIPKSLDINARYSQVAGFFGTASEYAVGSNWYPLRKTSLKLSIDATYLDGSPLQNTTSDIQVGDRGMLFRTQFQADF